MESVNRQVVQDRIGLVFDTMAGAQLTGKGIGNYVKALRGAVGLESAAKDDTKEFLQEFGKGI